jgi:hypothetical protein
MHRLSFSVRARTDYSATVGRLGCALWSRIAVAKGLVGCPPGGSKRRTEGRRDGRRTCIRRQGDLVHLKTNPAKFSIGSPRFQSLGFWFRTASGAPLLQWQSNKSRGAVCGKLMQQPRKDSLSSVRQSIGSRESMLGEGPGVAGAGGSPPRAPLDELGMMMASRNTYLFTVNTRAVIIPKPRRARPSAS